MSLSEDKIAQYLRVLELYVLPFLVVATIVLFCGYVASRIFHRAQSPRAGDEPAAPEIAPQKTPDEETAAFLRELSSVPPIEDPEPKKEQRSRFQRAFGRRAKSDKVDDAEQPPAADPEPEPGPATLGRSETPDPDAPAPEPQAETDQPLLLEETALVETPRPKTFAPHAVTESAPEKSRGEDDTPAADVGRAQKIPATGERPGNGDSAKSPPAERTAAPTISPNLADKRAEDILRALAGRHSGAGEDETSRGTESAPRRLSTVAPDGDEAVSQRSRDPLPPSDSQPMAGRSAGMPSGADRLPQSSERDLTGATAESSEPVRAARHTPSPLGADSRVEIQPSATLSEAADRVSFDGGRPSEAPTPASQGAASAATGETDRTSPEAVGGPESESESEREAETRSGATFVPPESGVQSAKDRDESPPPSVLHRAAPDVRDGAVAGPEPTDSSVANSDDEEKREAVSERTARSFDAGSGDGDEARKSVVRALNPSADPSAAALEAARGAARLLVEDIEQAVSTLQSGLETVVAHDEAKDGLWLEDVRSLKIAGFERASDQCKRLAAFGEHVAVEAKESLGSVGDFNHLVGRLEFVAAEQPLDEGWNELIRPRIQQTLAALRRAKTEISSQSSVAGPGRGGGPQQDMPFGSSKG